MGFHVVATTANTPVIKNLATFRIGQSILRRALFDDAGGYSAVVPCGSMRIALSADHAGFELKQLVGAHLTRKGHEVLDLGTHSMAPVDYPDSAGAVAQAMFERQADRGVIVCGSGAGVSIAANKFPGIRAAVCHDTYTAHQAVEHDDL